MKIHPKDLILLNKYLQLYIVKVRLFDNKVSEFDLYHSLILQHCEIDELLILSQIKTIIPVD